MCYFKDLNKLNDINEAQFQITRIISHQTKSFSYKDISVEIKKKLSDMGVSAHDLDSFKINNMISNTLDQMVDRGSLYCFNNIYLPKEKSTKPRNVFRFLLNQA